ncbi:hypothetical protein [Amycolatopsis sp. cmx-11-32]|uniref:hypothetical protein n=1 Tax=Amycolatopsis sp. cmx-11-32 TaxID=2785796 RepID=UPI0039E473A8
MAASARRTSAAWRSSSSRSSTGQTSSASLAVGLTRAAYVGTEAASALTMHLTKMATYGAGDLLTGQFRLYSPLVAVLRRPHVRAGLAADPARSAMRLRGPTSEASRMPNS